MLEGWRSILAAAAPEHARFQRALAAPRDAQLAMLGAILAANRDSEFGRAHGFAAIRDLADYRRAVPIAGYEAFAPPIARIAAGEAGVLSTAPAVAFEETGGTASGGKLVPYTAQGLADFRRTVLPWLADLATRRPAALAGPAYVTISPATRAPRTTPGGAPIGLHSDAAYLGDALAPAFAALLAVPPEVGAITDFDDWQAATLAALVAAESLAFISLWSPTFLLALLDALPARAEAVMAALNPPARRRLAAALASSVSDTARLWPRLDCISCWRDGASAPYAARLAALFPHATIENKGLLATEAAMTVPWGDGEGAVPALTSALLEFVGADGEARLCDELAVGESYALVVTTASGLYRYAIGDVVECVAIEGAAPRLRFAGRAGVTSDLVGEKLTEAFAASALAGLPCPAQLAARADPPGYVLLLDSDDAQAAALAAPVEARLCDNPQYAYARKLGQLAPLGVEPRPGLAAQAIHRGLAAGRRIGNLKPVALLPLRG